MHGEAKLFDLKTFSLVLSIRFLQGPTAERREERLRKWGGERKRGDERSEMRGEWWETLDVPHSFSHALRQ